MTAQETMQRLAGVRSAVRLVAFAVALLLTYVGLIVSPAGQDLDSSSFGTVGVPSPVFNLANLYRETAPIALIAVCAWFGIRALIKRRIAMTAAAAAIVVMSVLICEVLKLVLPRPDLGAFGYRANTFPSGHVALALSSVLALTVLAPPVRGRRPLIVVAAFLAVGVSWASVVSLAHRPSDVIGGALVVGFVASASFWERRTAADQHPLMLVSLVCGVGGGGILVLLGTLLGSPDPAFGSSVTCLGWFLLCMAPAVYVIGLAGLPASVA